MGKGSPLIADVINARGGWGKMAAKLGGLAVGKGVNDGVAVTVELLRNDWEIFTDKGLEGFSKDAGFYKKAEYALSHLIGVEWNSILAEGLSEVMLKRVKRIEKKFLESCQEANNARIKELRVQKGNAEERGDYDRVDELREEMEIATRVDPEIQAAAKDVVRPLERFIENVKYMEDEGFPEID